MPASFRAYIDESGDEGFLFDAGSSRWFVLSAVVVRKEKDHDLVGVLDDVRATISHIRRAELHFRKLSHAKRIPYVERLTRAPIRAASILVDKPRMQCQETS